MAVDVVLSWDLSPTTTSEVDGQRVYRSTASSPSFPSDYTEIADVSDNTTSFTDTGVNENQTVSYAVTAYNSAGESSPTTDSVSTDVTVTRSVTTGATGASASSRDTFSQFTRSATTGATGASASARVVDTVRDVTTGTVGASAAARTATKPRTAATGTTGVSATGRAATKPRSTTTGETGASATARVVDNFRASATGTTGTSASVRAATKPRSATTGETGASAASRANTLARSLTTFGAAGRSVADRAFDNWRIAGEGIRATTDLSAGPQTLTLATTIPASRLDTFRALGDRGGDLDTESGFGGSFRALDRGGGDVVDVLSPVSDRPPFPKFESFFIASYSESQLSPVRYEIEIELQRLANRDEATDPDTLQTGDEWTITLDTGATIGLSGRQVAPAERDGSPPGASVGLEIVVSSDQAAALLDRIGYPAGVVERSVPDGDDQLVDESGGRQTISVDAPADAAIDSGDWLVRGWSLSFNSFDESRRWRLSLSLGE